MPSNTARRPDWAGIALFYAIACAITWPLLAWRDFECSAFAAALLCPRQPFRQFLARESHDVRACSKLGITPAVMMRRRSEVRSTIRSFCS